MRTLILQEVSTQIWVCSVTSCISNTYDNIAASPGDLPCRRGLSEGQVVLQRKQGGVVRGLQQLPGRWATAISLDVAVAHY